MLPYRIAFESPGFLLLLLAVLPVVWWYGWRKLRAFGVVRRLTSIGLRTIVVTLFILALAEMQMLRISDRLTTIFLLDQSLSIPESQREAMVGYVNRAIVKHRKGDDRAGAVVFGRESAIEVPPYDDNVQIARVESQFDPQYTNLAEAMRLAEATFPEDAARRVVILTDGNENMGSALEQARALAAAGVGIDVLPVRYSQRAEIVVERVVVPNDVRRSQPFDLRVVVTNTAPTDREGGVVGGRLQVTRKEDGHTTVVSESPVKIPPGKQVFTIRQTLDDVGFRTYEARFVPDDPQGDMPQNNRASAFTQVRGKGQVLVIEQAEKPGEFAHFIDALKHENLEVTLRKSTEAFTTLPELQLYDTVVLANVPRDEFSDEQIGMLVRNTQQLGAGLVMLGGADSFGSGGWSYTEMEKAMPVDFQIKNAKVVPRGALVMIMHASEIPEGNFWQKKIAEEALKALGARDFCGIVQFDWGGGGMGNNGVAWLWNPGMLMVGSSRAMMLQKLTNLTPGDMPDFDPSMKLGIKGLTSVADKAGVRHMIIISDGDPSPASSAVLNSAVANKITVATVAVGAHGAPEKRELARIANATGGKFYSVMNNKTLPRIFQREARRVAQRLVHFNDNGFRPTVKFPHEMLSGIEATLPPIKGYVLTTKKENPLVEVAIVCPEPGAEENRTLLASWTYGLGRAVAFTTDAGQTYATSWSGWENYDKFFGQMVRWSMRPLADEVQYTVATDYKDGQVRVVVSALDSEGQFAKTPEMTGGAVGPSLESIDLRLEQTAPGRYVGSFATLDPGSYLVMVSPGPGRSPMRTGINVPFSDEFRARLPNDPLLEQLARLKPEGGPAGKLLDAPTDFDLPKLEPLLAVNHFRHDLRKATSSRDVWYYLLLIAGVMFFSDVFIRRVQVSFAWVPRVAGRVTDFVLRRKPAAPVPATIDRLRARKAEVTSQVEQLRAAARFEAAPDAPVDTSVLDAPVLRPPPEPKPAETKPAEPQEDTYTSRLLKAKKRVWDDKK